MGAPDDGVLLGEGVVEGVEREGPYEEAEGDDAPMDPVMGPSDRMEVVGDDVPMDPVKGPSDRMEVEVVAYRVEAAVNQPVAAVEVVAHQKAQL